MLRGAQTQGEKVHAKTHTNQRPTGGRNLFPDPPESNATSESPVKKGNSGVSSIIGDKSPGSDGVSGQLMLELKALDREHEDGLLTALKDWFKKGTFSQM